MVAGLDSWQAFQLDSALALKYDTMEKERESSYVEAILSTLDNVVRSNGQKVKKRETHESLIVPYHDKDTDDAKAIEDLPLIEDLVEAHGGDVLAISALIAQGKLEQYHGR